MPYFFMSNGGIPIRGENVIASFYPFAINSRIFSPFDLHQR
jgi:hypothetical protein